MDTVISYHIDKLLIFGFISLLLLVGSVLELSIVERTLLEIGPGRTGYPNTLELFGSLSSCLCLVPELFKCGYNFTDMLVIIISRGSCMEAVVLFVAKLGYTVNTAVNRRLLRKASQRGLQGSRPRCGIHTCGKAACGNGM